MSRFGDLIGGKTTPPIVVEPEPDVVEGDSDEGQVDLESLSKIEFCLLYTSPSPRDVRSSRMPSSA